MPRKSLALILLVVLLSACNFPKAPIGGITPTPVDTLQPISQPTEVIAASTNTPAVVGPIPSSSILIEGVSYTAWQIPGDPFRFVCQEPCPLDLQYIYAEYAGFRLAHAKLIELTGIDTLSELQPVDMHLVLEDSICSELPAGHAYVYSQLHQAYTCSDGPGYYPSLQEKIQMASQLEGQYFPLHEYMHTLFFGRLSAKAGDFEDPKAAFFHDFVVPIPSYAIGLLDPAGFCSNQTNLAPGDYGGDLIVELCTRNGFSLSDLSLSLIDLDKLYQSGGGQVAQETYKHPAATIAQYRDILNGVLKSDTTAAFANACWPPEFFGDSYTVLPACQMEPTLAGTPTPIK